MITIASDTHLKTSTLSVLNNDGKKIMQSKINNEPEKIVKFIRQFKGPKQFSMETCYNWPVFYDLLNDEVDKFHLLHAKKLKSIIESQSKCDKHDADELAYLTHIGYIPKAHTANAQTRSIRSLLRTRVALSRKVASIKNHIQAIVNSNTFYCQRPKNFKDLFCKRGLKYLKGLPLPKEQHFVVEQLLNQINPPVTYGEYGVMTIHRQKNTNKDRLTEILNFCGKIDHKIKFFVHHRTKPLLKNLIIPDNVCLLDSQTYSTMVKELASSRFILTDSGGINKIAPFFGKKALIFRDNIEWKETELSGYVKRFKPADNNQITWLLTQSSERQKRFYMEVDSPSKMVYNEIVNYLRRQ